MKQARRSVNPLRHARTLEPGEGRLGAIASLVPWGSAVADIGSGHGLLPRFLLESGRAQWCIASERTELLLNSVPGRQSLRPGTGRLELRWGDGLSVLWPGDRIDVVTITGLGGLSVLEILERLPGALAAAGCERLVLQPQTDLGEVRWRLLTMGFAIVGERLTRDRGRLYHALAAQFRPGAAAPSHPQLERRDLLEAGPCLVRDRNPLLAEYWSRQLERLNGILECNRSGAIPRGVLRQAAVARRLLDVIRGWGI